MRGLFITLEGNDGAGKTTVCQELVRRLQAEGVDAVYTREPGGSRIAEAVRDIILNPEHTEMDPMTEAILYAAARCQHMQECILPALQAGKVVLCDRFVDSSLAYQGFARKLGADTVWKLNEAAVQGTMPMRTIFLDLPYELGLERVHARGEMNRLDAESQEFHKAVANGYQAVCDMFPERIVKVDASQPLEDVIEDALRKVKEVL